MSTSKREESEGLWRVKGSSCGGSNSRMERNSPASCDSAPFPPSLLCYINPVHEALPDRAELGKWGTALRTAARETAACVERGPGQRVPGDGDVNRGGTRTVAAFIGTLLSSRILLVTV